MFCFGAASIADVEMSTPTRPNELLRAQEPPAWLHLFLDAEDCLSNCPLNCFSGNMNHEFGAKLPRTHRRRYFCTDCPDEGAICLGGIIEHHLKHRILKVRKLTGVGGPVIKVRDIEPLLNISSVLPHWSANEAFAYLKLKSFRQSVWGAGSEKILCLECLRLANSYESERYKYCSIKCAFPTAANIPPTSTAPDMYHLKGFMRSTSCRTSYFRLQRQEPSPPRFEFGAPASEKCASASPSPSTFDSPLPPSKTWRSRFSKYLPFRSSKICNVPKNTHINEWIPHDENISPLTKSIQEGKISGDKLETCTDKSPEGDQRGSKEFTLDETQGCSPLRQVLAEKQQPQENEKLKVRSPKLPSKDCNPWATSQVPRDSGLPKSTTITPVSVRLNRLNVKGGPITTIYWRTEQGYGSDEEEVQGKWGAVRSWVMKSVGLANATYTFENEPNKSSTETFGIFVSGFEPKVQSQEVGVFYRL